MVPYLDVQHLSKSFGALTLFHDISFSIGEGQRVGLIAKNGTGKSTLLSILSGKEGYDSGSIVFRRDLKVGMLEPKVNGLEQVAVYVLTSKAVKCHLQDVYQSVDSTMHNLCCIIKLCPRYNFRRYNKY